MRYLIKIFPILFLFSLLLLNTLTFSSLAQEVLEDPAEIVAVIETTDNLIPSVKVSEWTSINITVEDAYGINWTFISETWPITSRYWWPIRFPSWKPLLGYSSLRFEPEIVEGDPRGWYTRVTPSAISEADQGKKYHLNLEVKTDDIAVEYAVVVGIKTTRVNVFGEDFGVSYIYVPVKSSSLNNIKMEASKTTKEVSPKSHTSFDITVKNLGYYRDMFQLEFITDEKIITAASVQLFVLEPGESTNLMIDVLTPETLYDRGTPYKIEVYATSSSDQNPMHIGTVVVITKGIFISPLAFIITAPIIIIFLLILYIFFYQRKKKEKELLVKPERPWKIPAEKRYLEELRRKDRREYENEMLMMQDEYKSAMLWYEDHKIHILKGKTNLFSFDLGRFFKKSDEKKIKTEERKEEKQVKEDKPEEKPEKTVEKPEKKKEKPTKKVEEPTKKETVKDEPEAKPEIVKEQYESIKKRDLEVERKKQAALEKIKRAQEKQKRKIKK